CGGGQVCSMGACQATCAASLTLCSAACVDTRSDPTHCGGCGATCGAAEACLSGTCLPLACGTIAGPTLTENIGGWSDAGIQFTALADSVLTSFVFNQQGLADTISLVDDATGVVIASIPSAAGAAGARTITPSWPLTSGTTYRL